MARRPFEERLQTSDDLATPYEATRAGFVALALEKNRRATPYVAEARALQVAAGRARSPRGLLKITGIEAGLLTAAGLSDKALNHLLNEDKAEAINGLIKNFRNCSPPPASGHLPRQKRQGREQRERPAWSGGGDA